MTAAFLRYRFLIIFIILPNLLSIIYFCVIASPVYEIDHLVDSFESEPELIKSDVYSLGRFG